VYDCVQKPAAIEVCGEGEESEAFWAALGGKGEYSTTKDFDPPDFEPRLFNVSNASGFMWMKEVPAFAQEDLNNWDCYILDSWDTIYIWEGALSNKFERKGAATRAQKFLDGLNDGRNKAETLITTLEAGRESADFKVQFIQWEPEIAQAWLDDDPREIERKAKLSEEQKVAEKAAKGPYEGYLDPATTHFSYEELKGSFPQGVKHDAKEQYLADDEFQTVFGMSKADFNKMTFPKRVNAKKDKGLF